jgi:CRP/FNR family cyclic AMP-dependent transcriptional regulator
LALGASSHREAWEIDALSATGIEKSAPATLSQGERAAVLQSVLECTDEVGALLGRIATSRTALRRQILLHQGDHERQCHIVVAGSADIRVLGREGQHVQVATVEPGEIFGAYPEPAVARADIQARDAIELISFDAPQLARLAQAHSDIGAGLARIFSSQLGNVLDHFAARVTLTAVGRVYSYLLSTIDRGGRLPQIPSVSAIAVRAQTTRETASRAISALERRGIVRREADAWVVTSPRMLEELIV